MGALKSRVERLESAAPENDGIAEIADTLGHDGLSRMLVLTVRANMNALSDDQKVELNALGARIAHIPSHHLTSASACNEELLTAEQQKLINRLAEYEPEVREFATEKTWANQFQSPRHCAKWCVLVEKSDLLLDIRKRAAKLLRHRWKNCKLTSTDVDWLCKTIESSGLDLGKEGLWLRDHLDGSHSYYR